ncbi:MAG: hypothetical protein KKB46_03710, partial [Candidatus Omnitrophica bacterium]|nr:hypothetical protein [Candidatus Omnitrophota bacterium]
MGNQKFSKKEALRFGWVTMKNNIGFFIGILMMAGLFAVASGIITKTVELNKGNNAVIFLLLVIAIAIWALQRVVEMGSMRIALKFNDKEKPIFSDLFSCFHLFFKYIAGTILYLLIMIGGLCLLVVPGIIWMIKFQFFGFLIIDKNLGPIEALKKSYEITRGVKWNLFLFHVIM